MSWDQFVQHQVGLDIGAALGQDSESLREFAQLGAWPQAGELEQVASDEPGAVLGVGEFGGELFGLLEVVDGFADLAPWRVLMRGRSCA
jgi:hypothetical protein